MQIRIRDNARELYHIYNRSYNNRYVELLGIVEGMWLTVDKHYLLPDSYMVRDKTYGINVMIPNYMVEEVKNDARIGKYRCSSCGYIQGSPDLCAQCGKPNIPKLSIK